MNRWVNNIASIFCFRVTFSRGKSKRRLVEFGETRSSEERLREKSAPVLECKF